MDKAPYIIIFIPAFNEQGTIGRLIRKIRELHAEEKDYSVDIVVVDDGSTDGTVQEARESGVKRIFRHPRNSGLGAATRSGLQVAFEMGADIAVKIDADFQHDPEDIDKVIRPILDDRADVVFGSRFLGEIKYKMPWGRKIGNAFFTSLTSKLTGLHITDAQTGLMAFSRRYLRNFALVANYNETQQLIIDSWSRHMRILEVPVVFHQRIAGHSFISLKYPFNVLPTILRMLVQAAPLRVFFPMGTFIILLGIVAIIAILANFAPSFIGDITVAILLIGGLLILMFGLLADAIVKRG